MDSLPFMETTKHTHFLPSFPPPRHEITYSCPNLRNIFREPFICCVLIQRKSILTFLHNIYTAPSWISSLLTNESANAAPVNVVRFHVEHFQPMSCQQRLHCS